MILDLSQFSIFIRPGKTDMRKQINGLSEIAEDEMELDLQAKNIFLFCGSNQRLLKCLYWDSTGFCLWQKRLSKDRFPWPKSNEEAQSITYDQLQLLLSGIDFWKAHKPLYFEEMN